MVEDFSAGEGRFLCVTYDKFELPSGFRLENADLAYHLTQVCRALLIAMLIDIDDNPSLAEGLSDHQKRLLKHLTAELLGGLSAAQFEEALKSIKSRGDRVRDWLHRYETVVKLVSMVSTKLGLGAVQVSPGSFDIGTQDESLRYQFTQLLEIAQVMGYASTYVLVDGVDELGLTGSDASATYRFIDSLISDLPTLETPGGAFKFFMWDQIEDSYRAGGARPDRIPQHRLNWNVAQLEEMMAKRLMAFSNNAVQSVNDLLCDDVPVDLHRLIAYFASGSPRDMVRMAARIVAEQTRESASATCLEQTPIWAGIASFSRERAEELFGSDYLDQLTKIGEATFTISHLASDVYRISENAARSRVQKWLETGLVAKIGEVPSKGRPQNLYGVSDIRLAIAMLPAMDLPTALGNIAIECPTCGNVCISDRTQIDCPRCGAPFALTDSRSLLQVCERRRT